MATGQSVEDKFLLFLEQLAEDVSLLGLFGFGLLLVFLFFLLGLEEVTQLQFHLRLNLDIVLFIDIIDYEGAIPVHHTF